MSSRLLKVLLAGQLAGALSQHQSGELSFEYELDYVGPPLSLSMPISNRVYGDKIVRPFLFGLLPDDAEVRQSMGREFGVAGNNPFALLEHVGLDCPGAVQFCRADSVEETLGDRFGSLEPITDDEIAHRLKKSLEYQAAAWMDEREHWSLGGQQCKFALRRKGGAWFRCEGTAATTHILKPGISHLKYQALDEFVCMQTASISGLATAQTSYTVFAGEPAIVVKRYDRLVDEGGKVLRLHQEDFCQILGVLPDNKYAQYGGPGAADVIDVLKTTGAQAPSNIRRFIEMLFFNYLLGAPDAHAKNYSVLLGAQAPAVLAPLYDVASVFPYRPPSDRIKTAMSIGGENVLGKVGSHHIRSLVEANALEDAGFSYDECAEIMAGLARAVPSSLERAFESCSVAQEAEELRDRLVGPVETLCKTTLAKL